MTERTWHWPSDFGPVPLPAKFKADDRWKGQLDIAYQIVEEFEHNDVVFLAAPTGTGKTLIAELVRRIMSARAVYSCTTKALQDQFVQDFTYAKVLKGRSNYLTFGGQVDEFGNEVDPEEAINCADCSWNPDSGVCRWCPSRSLCPYVLARSKAESAPLAVLNTSYLLTDISKGKGRFVGRNLNIVDEADVLEDEFLNHIEVKITQRGMERMGLIPPERRTIERSWVHWVNTVAEPGIRTYLANLPNPSSDDASAKDIRRYNYTKSLLEKVELLAKELPEGGWVYDGYKYDDVIFRPIKTARYGDQLLWNHGRKFLCMSATILSADLMVEELGICYTHNRPYTTIEVPSNYPVENRPIHVAPVANMVYKEKLTAWPSMIAGLRGVLNLHPDERILVHCVSYELARYLVAGVKDANRPIITYYGSAHKAKALRDYAATHNSVMIAASMDRGIDLPDDMCRVQVVAKIPWPNTADKRINARMYSKGGSAWYAMHAVRTLIQMTGRGIRSPEDHAETYILDAQFGENLYKHEYLFPKWWKEALNWRFNKRKLVR